MSERTKRSTVLVVDDESLLRALAIEVFEERGFEVLEAANGEEALAVLETRADVSILFSDVNMPGLSGLDLAAQVHQARPHVRIVLTSGKTEPRGDEAAPLVFVRKPYDLEKVAGLMLEWTEPAT